jgi:hypothetical protein
MKKAIIAASLGFIAVLGAGDAGATGPTPSGRDVMAKAAQASSFAQLATSSTLTIGGVGHETRSKSFTLSRKLAGDGVHHRALTRFLAPAEIRGEGVLFDERTNGQNEVLLYLPRFKKVRRVEAQAQRSSFMGSSFSYTDMTSQAVDDYRHELARTESCPADATSSCFVVTSLPANDTVRANHGYSKKTTWVRTKDHQTIQTELFDADGAMWKRVSFSDIREVDAARHRAMSHKVHVEDLKAKRFSTIKIEKVDVQTPIADGLFNEQSLAREI